VEISARCSVLYLLDRAQDDESGHWLEIIDFGFKAITTDTPAFIAG
jgi:hypothetical protein